MSLAAILLAVVTLVFLADIALGLVWWRYTPPGDVGAAPAPDAADLAQRRRIGRFLVIVSPFLWLFFAALCFGLFGDVGFGTIQIQSGS